MPELFSHISCILICSHLYKDFYPSLKFIIKYRLVEAGREKIPNLPGLDDGAISDETLYGKMSQMSTCMLAFCDLQH